MVAFGLGIFVGANPAVTIAWGIAMGVWWVSIGYAIWCDLCAMHDGTLERLDVGLQCIVKGLQYAGMGGFGIAAGIRLNQRYNEQVLQKSAEELIDKNPAKDLIGDEVSKNVVAGVIQFVTGLAVVGIGVLILNGVIE